MEQISFFDGNSKFTFSKPIRLIELFGGIGSQAKALENLGVNFEHYRLCEFDRYAVDSYNAQYTELPLNPLMSLKFTQRTWELLTQMNMTTC